MSEVSSNKSSRRSFLEKSAVIAGAAALSPIMSNTTQAITHPRMAKDDISLAQWALVSEIRNREWGTLDFPKVAREDFDLNGIEFVNTLFDVPTLRYLKELKRNAETHGVELILIMVDGEGDPDVPSKQDRSEFVTMHKKWIDIAHYLGCHAIRTNCRGAKGDSMQQKQDALNWAAESYHELLDYSIPAGIKVTIENHGGVSNDPDWIVELMELVDNPYLGTYPDWRSTDDTSFDTVDYLTKTVPYAYGQSYRNQPTEADGVKLLKISRDSGYRGWYGIESSGRDAIRQGIQFLKKHL